MNESTINKRIHVLKVVLLGNLTICIGKIIVGILSGLLFIVADGIHSLSDTLTNFVGIFSLKLATRKPDEKHPYGYEKYETIGTLILFAHSVSCSIAAARKVSPAPSITDLPLVLYIFANLAIVVVLPAPLTPMIS